MDTSNGPRLGPALAAPYLPKSMSGQGARIEGEVLRMQREANRLLAKVGAVQGPILVIFTQKVAELDLLLEPGDTVTLLTPGYAIFDRLGFRRSREDPVMADRKAVAKKDGAGESDRSSRARQAPI
jgi:hypothetical protein